MPLASGRFRPGGLHLDDAAKVATAIMRMGARFVDAAWLNIPVACPVQAVFAPAAPGADSHFGFQRVERFPHQLDQGALAVFAIKGVEGQTHGCNGEHGDPPERGFARRVRPFFA